MRISRRTLISAAACGAVVLSAPARAAPADSFYRGKTLTVIVGFAPGGGVDSSARVVARHLVRFIPGEPKTMVKNMEGGAGAVATNYLTTRGSSEGRPMGVTRRTWSAADT